MERLDLDNCTNIIKPNQFADLNNFHCNHHDKNHNNQHASSSSSGMQVVLKWHQWQQIQTTLRWSRASGWGQNNISYIFRSNVFLTEKFDICFPRWASMTRRTRPPWENAFVEIFYFFMFLSLFLYQTMELPSQIYICEHSREQISWKSTFRENWVF